MTTIKYAFLAWFGGSAYVTAEVFFRARSHWTMFLVGALCFVLIGLLNERLPWALGLAWQTIIGCALVTGIELVTGCIVNLWLGWGVWDYSGLPGNILGQVCPQFVAAWAPLVLLAIVVDDVIRWRFFGEERPRYTLF